MSRTRSPSPPAPPRGRLDDVLTLWVSVGALLVVAGWTWPAWGGAVSIACPLKQLTGWPCLTCGGTRAFVAAVAGRWVEALGWNPLVGLGGLALVLGLPVASAGLASGRRPELPAGTRMPAARWWRLAVLGALAANWAYLVIAGV